MFPKNVPLLYSIISGVLSRIRIESILKLHLSKKTNISQWNSVFNQEHGS